MTPTRQYRSELRARQAAQTRDAILAAARRRFADHGFAAVTIKEIADAAGVSAQTVYSTFASKAGLALALIAFINEEAGAAEMARDMAAARTPRQLLGASVHLVCVLHERIGDIIRVLLDAARVDNALEPAVAAGRASHAQPQHHLAERLARAGALHESLTVETAAGLLTVCTSPEAIERYVVEVQWTYAGIEAELTEAMVRALCRPETADQPCLPPEARTPGAASGRDHE
jgi:AcrR family transcriptional regulator